MEEGEVQADQEFSDDEVVRRALDVPAVPASDAEAYILAVRNEGLALPFHAEAPGCAPVRLPAPPRGGAPVLSLAWAAECVRVVEARPRPPFAGRTEDAVLLVCDASRAAEAALLAASSVPDARISECAIAQQDSGVGAPYVVPGAAEDLETGEIGPGGDRLCTAGKSALNDPSPLSDASLGRALAALRSLRPGTLSFFQLSALRAAALRFARVHAPAADAIVACVALRFGQRDLLRDDSGR